MKTAEIAQRFLDYFEKNGHTIVPSASLVTDDPARYLTVANNVVALLAATTAPARAPWRRSSIRSGWSAPGGGGPGARCAVR